MRTAHVSFGFCELIIFFSSIIDLLSVCMGFRHFLFSLFWCYYFIIVFVVGGDGGCDDDDHIVGGRRVISLIG